MKSILKSILFAGGCGLLSTIPVSATQLLHEDFDSYSDGSVNGQGLWTASAGIDVFSDANGARIHVGATAAAATASRPLDGSVSLGADDVSVLSFQGYAYSFSQVSHNSGAYLGSSTVLSALGWRSMQDSVTPTGVGWVFDASSLTGNASDLFAPAISGIGTPFRFEVVVDGVNNVGYGRMQALTGLSGTPTGPVYQSPQYGLTDVQIASLDRLSLEKRHDSSFVFAFPPSTEFGAEFDNFSVQVPDGGSALGSLGGACVALLAFARVRSKA